MADSDRIVLFYAPQTRATGTRILLEELGAPYDLRVLNMKLDEQRKPGFLAISPLGKAPAIRHGDVVVTEQIAIALYLADLFPQAGLTPAIGDEARGAFLRWMVYQASCFEPAVVDRAMKREPAPHSTSPYGGFEEMLAALEAQIAKGPFLVGGRLTVADIVWGTALRWTTMFGIVPKTPVIAEYVGRITARPSFVKVTAADVELAAARDAAATAAASTP